MDLLSQSRQYLLARDLEAAIESYRAYTERAPEDPQGWLGLGQAYMAKGDLDRAIGPLERSWQSTGSSCEALHLLFIAEAVRGRTGRCLELAAHIPEADPFLNDYEPLWCAIRQQERSKRLRWLFPSREFVRRHSSNRLLRVFLHLMLLSPHRLASGLAANAMWNLRRQVPPSEPLEISVRDRTRFLGDYSAKNLERLAFLLLMTSQSASCLKVALDGLNRFSDRPEFDTLAAHACFEIGDSEPAFIHYECAYRKSGRDSVPCMNLGSALVFQGKIRESNEVFQQGTREHPGNPALSLLAGISVNTLRSIPESPCIRARKDSFDRGILSEEVPNLSLETAPWNPVSSAELLLQTLRYRSIRKRHTPIRKHSKSFPCPACRSEQISPFVRNRASGFDLGRCRVCDHVFASPMPPDERLQSLYGDDYFASWDLYAKYILQLHALGRTPNSYPLYDALFEWLDRIDWKEWETARGEGRIALDVGCASGAMLIALRNREWRVVGQDIGGAYEEYYRTLGIPYHRKAVKDVELEDASFDLCTMTHVIEHLADPGETLDRVSRLLKPGGRLLLMTPCCGTIGAWLSGKTWFYMSEHVQYFTPSSLQRLAGRFGLNALYWRTRMGHKFETPFRVLRSMWFGGALQRMLEQIGHGDVIEIVFEK